MTQDKIVLTLVGDEIALAAWVLGDLPCERGGKCLAVAVGAATGDAIASLCVCPEAALEIALTFGSLADQLAGFDIGAPPAWPSWRGPRELWARAESVERAIEAAAGRAEP